MTTTVTNGLDLAAIKRRQQQTWASGDYAAVAARIVPMAEVLAQAADLAAGSTLLDVATGSGNAALAAARCDARVTGIDYVPALLDRGRARAAAEGLDVDFVDGDAEAMPVPDAAFDAVLSCLGVMFTPDQERAAAELLRVCRPGGRIALAAWTPEGFIGELFRAIGRHVSPPAGLPSPLAWGTEARLAELLGDGVAELTSHRRAFVFRFTSPEDFAAFFSANYGPVGRALACLDDPGRQRLYGDLIDLARRHDTAAGPSTALPSEYLEAVAVRAAR